ncbi:DNA circularization N-terminal domain-containing protein [Erwinia aphidicola]|uniref:DNA circularization protein n=1 Tax=Erwinia aphidicola TaxID=68334 RepID=UPI0030D3D23B
MSWEEDLQDASFRGVRFDVVTAKDRASKDVARYEYPWIDGGDLDDLGRKPRDTSMTAIFWGDDYESRLQAFLKALDARGPGELIHPVFGSMPKMVCLQYEVTHEADMVDYASLDLAFTEAGTSLPFFSQDYPLSQADALFNQVQTALDDARAMMEKALQPLRTAKKYMRKAIYLGNTASNMLAIFRSEISGFVSTSTDFVNYPATFMADLSSALSLTTARARSAVTAAENAGSRTADIFRGSAPGIIMADWGQVRSEVAKVALLPAQLATGERDAPLPVAEGITTEDIAEIRVLTQLQCALQLALDASDILSDDGLTASLSPVNIEQISNDARTALQDAIALHRERYTPVGSVPDDIQLATAQSWQPVVKVLKSVALTVQELARAVITLRPPLVRRKVETTCNLHLLAHAWYGDATRAGELLRLNPGLRNPNTLKRGDRVYGYSK